MIPFGPDGGARASITLLAHQEDLNIGRSSTDPAAVRRPALMGASAKALPDIMAVTLAGPVSLGSDSPADLGRFDEDP